MDSISDASQAEPLVPSADAFWGDEIEVDGVRPVWLAEQEPYVWIQTIRWLDQTRRRHSYESPFCTTTADWSWRHREGDVNIRAIRLPADHAIYASGTEARSGETAGLDPKDNGPVPQADAEPSSGPSK